MISQHKTLKYLIQVCVKVITVFPVEAVLIICYSVVKFCSSFGSILKFTGSKKRGRSLYSAFDIANCLTTKAFFWKQKPSTSSITDISHSFLVIDKLLVFSF